MKKKIKKTKMLLSLLLAALMLTSCGLFSDNNNDGEVAVFYFTFSDTYISGVRSAMDDLLNDAGMKNNSYDANGNQTTQTEQIQTAIAKGASALVVNVVDTGSNDAAMHIVNLAKEKDIPVIFFNRSVEESVINSYDKCVFVGTDYAMAGRLQGEMIAGYLMENYDKYDLNGDGVISYVMFKGQEGNMEAIARTQYSVEECDRLLKENGYSPLRYYDASNKNKYLVDQDGLWSSAAATNYMSTILAQYSTSSNNMVELVIANNDEMALGAISSLQSAGYNTGRNSVTIPVFGVDATDAARSAIKNGVMAGTVKQDAEGMAEAIMQVLENFKEGNDKLDGIDEENIVGSWKINIPYAKYFGEED